MRPRTRVSNYKRQFCLGVAVCLNISSFHHWVNMSRLQASASSVLRSQALTPGHPPRDFVGVGPAPIAWRFSRARCISRGLESTELRTSQLSSLKKASWPYSDDISLYTTLALSSRPVLSSSAKFSSSCDGINSSCLMPHAKTFSACAQQQIRRVQDVPCNCT